MHPHIALISLVVRDYDEALDFCTRALGFGLVEDTERPGGTSQR
jgi:catechol 2,3-dioxygenase-like lactoylglutathione lyase family enzyme